MTLTIGSLPDWLPAEIADKDIQNAVRTRRIRITEFTGINGEIIGLAYVKQSTEGRASLYGANHSINPGSGSYTSTGLITEVVENHSANEPDRTEVNWVKKPD